MKKPRLSLVEILIILVIIVSLALSTYVWCNYRDVPLKDVPFWVAWFMTP